MFEKWGINSINEDVKELIDYQLNGTGKVEITKRDVT